MRIVAAASALALLAGCPQEPAPEPRKASAAPQQRDDADDEEGGGDAATTRRDPRRPYVPLPRTPELEVPDEALRALLAIARAGCDGAPAPAAAHAVLGTDAPLIGVAYGVDGARKHHVRRDDAGTLAQKAHAIGRELCRAERSVYLHLLVVTKRAHLLNFGVKGLFDNKVFEPQVTGVVYRLDDKRFELDPLEQLERNMGPSDARTALARGVGLSPQEAPNRVDLTIELYRTAHVGERLQDRAATRFFRGHRVLTHADVTHELLEERLRLIGDWYRANVIDGEVTYIYMPSRRAYANDERTMIRSTMATWILNRLAVYLKDAELAAKGEEAIEHYFERYFRMSASKAAGRIMPSPTPLKNGNRVEQRWTVASFIAAACNERTDKERFRTEMDLLMKWAATHQREDGVVWSPSGAEQYFMPGQFLLPVTYFYRDTKDPFYKAIFDKAFAVYAPNLYETMELGPAWHTPYAPAWFTQPVAQMYLLTGDEALKDLVFAINDRVALAYDTNARHQVYYDYDGMLAPKPNSYGNNSVTSASLEALTDAAIVAKHAGDRARYERYTTIIRRTVAYLLRLQYVPENTYYIRDRARVVGGFKNDLVNTKSWMDSVWHLTSAFIKIQQHRLFEPTTP